MSIDTGQQTVHIGESGNRGGHGSIGLSRRRGIKGDLLNCCGKMPSLRRAVLPESSNLPKQLRMSPRLLSQQLGTYPFICASFRRNSRSVVDPHWAACSNQQVAQCWGRSAAMERSARRAIVTRDRFTCQSCHRRTWGQVHHILPRSQGGPDLPANLVTLCGWCHMLVSPIQLHVLRRVLRMSVEEILVEKARVEVAVHSWVLYQAAKPAEGISQAVSEPWPRRRPAARLPTQPTRPIPEWKRL